MVLLNQEEPVLVCLQTFFLSSLIMLLGSVLSQGRQTLDPKSWSDILNGFLNIMISPRLHWRIPTEGHSVPSMMYFLSWIPPGAKALKTDPTDEPNSILYISLSVYCTGTRGALTVLTGAGLIWTMVSSLLCGQIALLGFESRITNQYTWPTLKVPNTQMFVSRFVMGRMSRCSLTLQEITHSWLFCISVDATVTNRRHLWGPNWRLANVSGSSAIIRRYSAAKSGRQHA